MTKTKSLIALCALALFVVSLNAQEVNVAGEWEMTSEGRQGPRTQIFKIEQDGEKITVTTEGRRGPMKGEGTIKGNEIEWTFTMSMGDRGDMTMTYKGEVEGDSMKGEVQMGDFGSREWTAKKK